MSPVDQVIRAAERRRKRLVVRQLVQHRQHGVLAVHVKLGVELIAPQQVGVDATQADAGDLREQAVPHAPQRRRGVRWIMVCTGSPRATCTAAAG